jgi:YbgC/YbaW family acyl-CoA thioester hydrolase
MAGMAHFSNFFRYMESAEVEFLHSRGLSVSVGLQGEKFGFPRVAASCDFMLPLRFQDVVQIDVRVERIGNKSITYAFDFSRGGDLVADGRITTCCCRVLPDLSLEPIDIPQSIRDLLENKQE